MSSKPQAIGYSDSLLLVIIKIQAGL